MWAGGRVPPGQGYKMAMNSFPECVSNDIFLNIRKYIYVTLNNSESRTFFLIVFRSRIREKNQVEGGDD
jgi:hypothetical protein